MRPVVSAPGGRRRELSLSLACLPVLVALVAGAARAGRRPRDLGGATLTAALAVVLAAAAVAAWIRGWPPERAIDAFLVLREGREWNVFNALGAPDPWLSAHPVNDPWPLRTRLALHVAEVGLALGLVAVATARVAGPALGVAVGATLLVSPLALHAARSDGEGAPVTLLAVIAGLSLLAPATDRADRALCLLTVGGAALAAGTLRTETAILGVPGTLWALARTVGLGDGAELRRGEAALFALLVSSAALAALAPATARFSDVFGGLGVTPGQGLAAQLGTLRAMGGPLALLPVGAAALAAVGGLAARRVAGAALLAAAIFLLRVYAQASHVGDAPYETLRYGGLVLGPIAVAAVVGARIASDVLGQHRGVAAAWALVSIVAPRPFAPPEIDDVAWAPVRTTQTEGAHYLARLRARFPQCLLVSPNATDVNDASAPMTRQVYTWALGATGGPLGWSMPVLGAEALAREADRLGLARPAPSADPWAPYAAISPCVLLVRGLDANLAGSGIDGLASGLPAWETRVIDVPEHNAHHGARTGPLHLAVYVPVGAPPDGLTP
jgi:hypothetical protein